MGLFTLSKSYKDALEIQAEALHDTYKTYRILSELAPMFTDKDKQTEDLKLKNKAYYEALIADLKRIPGIPTIENGDFKAQDYTALFSFIQIKKLGDDYGFEVTKGDYTNADGSIKTGYKDLADMLIQHKITPAMDLAPWRGDQKFYARAYMAIAIAYIVTFTMDGFSNSMVPYASALFALTIVKLALSIVERVQAETMMTDLGQKNRRLVDMRINELQIKHNVPTKNSATNTLVINSANIPANVNSLNVKDPNAEDIAEKEYYEKLTKEQLSTLTL